MTELGSEARAMLEAGRAGDEPTSADRARIHAAVISAVAASAAAAAGEGAAAASMAKGAAAVGATGVATLWKPILVGLVLGALASGPVLLSSPSGAPAVVSPVAPSAIITAPPIPPASASPSPTIPLPADPERDPPPAARPLAKLAPSSLAPAVAASVTPDSPGAPADSLAAETRGLGDAHAALNDGDPATALSLLDQQSATFTSGQLREERAVARILALCQLGRVDEARALSERFLADSPRSPLAKRVRSACLVSPR